MSASIKCTQGDKLCTTATNVSFTLDCKLCTKSASVSRTPGYQPCTKSVLICLYFVATLIFNNENDLKYTYSLVETFVFFYNLERHRTMCVTPLASGFSWCFKGSLKHWMFHRFLTECFIRSLTGCFMGSLSACLMELLTRFLTLSLTGCFRGIALRQDIVQERNEKVESSCDILSLRWWNL